MNWKALRLVLAIVLFTAWMAYLGYAALDKGRGPIVSRVQAAAAAAAFVADLQAGENGEPTREATVVEALTPNGPAAGTKIVVANLPMARGFEGAGRYLLLLDDAHIGYTISQPRSPGTSYKWSEDVYRDVPPPVIYTWNDSVRTQYEKFRGGP